MPLTSPVLGDTELGGWVYRNQPMFHGKPQGRGHHVPDFVTGFMAELGRIEPRQVRLNVES